MTYAELQTARAERAAAMEANIVRLGTELRLAAKRYAAARLVEGTEWAYRPGPPDTVLAGDTLTAARNRLENERAALANIWTADGPAVTLPVDPPTYPDHVRALALSQPDLAAEIAAADAQRAANAAWYAAHNPPILVAETV